MSWTKKSETDPIKDWKNLIDHILNTIDYIDKGTPASIMALAEPNWWVDMMRVRREVQKIKDDSAAGEIK